MVPVLSTLGGLLRTVEQSPDRHLRSRLAFSGRLDPRGGSRHIQPDLQMVVIDLGHWQVTHTVPTSLTVSRARPNSMRSVVIARRQQPTPCPRVPGIRFPCGGWKLTGAPAFGVSAIMESVASRYSTSRRLKDQQLPADPNHPRFSPFIRFLPMK